MKVVAVFCSVPARVCIMLGRTYLRAQSGNLQFTVPFCLFVFCVFFLATYLPTYLGEMYSEARQGELGGKGRGM